MLLCEYAKVLIQKELPESQFREESPRTWHLLLHDSTSIQNHFLNRHHCSILTRPFGLGIRTYISCDVLLQGWGLGGWAGKPSDH